MNERQSWNPENYARHARFVSDLGAPVLELLAPRAGERILDLGCGDGALTTRLVELGCRVIAVDASRAQIEAAKSAGLDAHVMDGEALQFQGEFDAVFSNAALHWMKRPARVIDGVFRALRPGGRFVAEFGGVGCVSSIKSALFAALGRRGMDGASFDPWYFPSADDYSARLVDGGFRVESVVCFPRPTALPTDIVGWLETFAQSFLVPLPVATRPAFLKEVRDALEPALSSSDGVWTADYVRLRFVASKPV